MMIHATPFYEIAADQIEALSREEEKSGGHRFILKIFTKGGRTYRAKYLNEADREADIERIKNAINEAKEKERQERAADLNRAFLLAKLNSPTMR